MNNRKTSRRKFLTKSGLGALGLPFLGAGCSRKDERDRNQDTFSFAFVTDIHLKPEMHAPEGFQMAIDRVNELQPDFVITGGDLVYDAMRGDFDRCDMLFQLYKKMSSGFTMPVFNCLGNHDLFAIYGESQEPASHPDYKYGMWERYFGDTYYSFDHKGWHFITLNSLDVTEDQRYRGIFSDEQLDWLLSDLAEVSTETPIVVTTHIPMICTRTQLIGSANTPNVANSATIFQMMENHNLKLILQGHIHWTEYGYVNERFHFLTEGSIAGNGWKGRRHNTREGFMLLSVNGEDFDWQYVDHGWESERIKRKLNEEVVG